MPVGASDTWTLEQLRKARDAASQHRGHFVETTLSTDVVRLLRARQLVRVLADLLGASYVSSSYARFYRVYILARAMLLQLLRSKNGLLLLAGDADALTSLCKVLCGGQALSLDDTQQLRLSTFALPSYLFHPARCQPRQLAYLLTVHVRALFETDLILAVLLPLQQAWQSPSASTPSTSKIPGDRRLRASLCSLVLMCNSDSGRYACCSALSFFDGMSCFVSFLYLLLMLFYMQTPHKLTHTHVQCTCACTYA